MEEIEDLKAGAHAALLGRGSWASATASLRDQPVPTLTAKLHSLLMVAPSPGPQHGSVSPFTRLL